MVIRRKPLILGSDLVALGVVVLLLSLTGAIIGWRARESAVEAPRLRDRLVEEQNRLGLLSVRNPVAARALDELEVSLRDQASQPLADVSVFLARMSEDCRQTQINLVQVQPLPAAGAAEFRTWSVQVTADGRFPDFLELLRRIESCSDYVQVHELLVVGGGPNEAGTCRLSWTVRVNSLPEAVLAGGSNS